MDKKQVLPWWQKYTLTLNEASEYFGIGYKKLKMFVEGHSDEEFVLWNGNRALIKREPDRACNYLAHHMREMYYFLLSRSYLLLLRARK